MIFLISKDADNVRCEESFDIMAAFECKENVEQLQRQQRLLRTGNCVLQNMDARYLRNHSSSIITIVEF